MKLNLMYTQKVLIGIDYSQKDKFNFISIIRLPDFVTKKDFDWAICEATKKKKQDFSRVEFITFVEGKSTTSTIAKMKEN